MTAEIAVFNSSAIALAADSAVTISRNGMVKINNNADKLFELSKHHPIGAMIFNNASLAGAPWELLIKSYRKQLGSAPKNTVHEYSADLIEYIQNDKLVITNEMRARSAQNIFQQKISAICQEINQIDIVVLLQARGGDVTTADFYAILQKKIFSYIEDLLKKPYFPSLDESNYEDAKEYVKSYVRVVASKVVPQDAEHVISDELWSCLEHFAALLLCKQNNSNSFTGVVFAGYGEQEHYPSIRTIHVYGFFKDNLLYTEDQEKTEKSECEQAGILPFAQEDEVVTFIEGCSRSVNEFTNNLASEIASRAKTFIATTLNGKVDSAQLDSLYKELEQHFHNSVNDFTIKKNSFIQSTHVSKMLSMLNSLGKVDLAYMAESLVDITAFKRKISNDHETVGGPVDVAVISKGDGFVWIKRKHYFIKELNHNFFERNNH